VNFVDPEIKFQEIIEERKKRKFPKTLDIIILITFSFLMGVLISFQKSYFIPELKLNEIAKEDIVAPFDFETIDKKATQAKREEASKLVNPVYILDSYKYLFVERKIKDIFSLGRDFLLRGEVKKEKQAVELLKEGIKNVFEVDINPEVLRFLVREGFNSNLEKTVLSILKEAFEKGIFLTKNSVYHKNGKITVVGENGELKDKGIDEVLDLISFKKYTEDLALKMGLKTDSVKKISEFCSIFISPNLVYDEALTRQRINELSERIYPVIVKIPKGKPIIKKGEKITQDDIELISLIKKKMGVPVPIKKLVLYFSILLLGSAIFIPFYNLFQVLEVSPRKIQILFLSLIFIEIFLLKSFKIFLEKNISMEWLLYYFPFFLAPLLISYLLDRKLAILFTLFSLIPITIFYIESPELILYAFLTSSIASNGANIYGKVERYSILRVITFIILPFNALLIIILTALRGNFSEILSLIAGMLIGCIFSIVITPILIPLLELSFGIVTQMRLVELGNSEHPLLKRMAIEAPGTYHHSLMVASLAEQAARAIGANYNLVKVSALFHDAGKIEEPQYFIENQEKDFNIHDKLTPEKSSSIIINHISKGIEILKKARIPSIIRELVQQHHGESLIAPFYQKALLEMSKKEAKPQESLFRYQGPKPQTKEASILMLADAVEAASKSLPDWDPEKIRKMIDEIITKFLEDGQLDDSGLTIKDLYLIANSFYWTFIRFYKQRIPYPGFQFQKESLPIQ
jgi:putative nucleotidyltransferase with HDIG domain